MTHVFISGSMRIKHLDAKVLARIDNILDKEFTIIVGDSDGVDSSVQQYLSDYGAEHVLVYCSDVTPRNNIGHWKTRRVETSEKPGTRAFYTAKDLAMAEDCDYGLMVWDSKSTGTLKNAMELLKRGKKSVVYIHKLKEFITISDVPSLESLLRNMTPAAFEKADIKLKISRQIESMNHRQQELFA